VKTAKLPLFAKGNADVLRKFVEPRKIRSEIWQLLRTAYKLLRGAVLLGKKSLVCTLYGLIDLAGAIFGNRAEVAHQGEGDGLLADQQGEVFYGGQRNRTIAGEFFGNREAWRGFGSSFSPMLKFAFEVKNML
jgi:hypothetical protein